MPPSLHRSAVARNAATDAQTALVNGGKLRFYSGARPATPEAAATGTLLVELTLASPAFGAAVAGVATANPIPQQNALATGVIGYYRVFKADGTTAIWDGTVDTANANCVLPTTATTAGVPFAIGAFTHTEDMQGS